MKIYYGSNGKYGMKLAQESILKQYGYSVSKTEDLSDTVRQKILAVLIDNHIITKNDIISYLDFLLVKDDISINMSKRFQSGKKIENL